MSINSEMRKQFELQQKVTAITSTGERTKLWQRIKDIGVAVRPKSEMNMSASVLYKDCTHTGHTNVIGIEADTHRLYDVVTGDIYSIVSVIGEKRRSEMLLKRVVTRG